MPTARSPRCIRRFSRTPTENTIDKGVGAGNTPVPTPVYVPGAPCPYAGFRRRRAVCLFPPTRDEKPKKPPLCGFPAARGRKNYAAVSAAQRAIHAFRFIGSRPFRQFPAGIRSFDTIHVPDLRRIRERLFADLRQVIVRMILHTLHRNRSVFILTADLDPAVV